MYTHQHPTRRSLRCFPTLLSSSSSFSSQLSSSDQECDVTDQCWQDWHRHLPRCTEAQLLKAFAHICRDLVIWRKQEAPNLPSSPSFSFAVISNSNSNRQNRRLRYHCTSAVLFHFHPLRSLCSHPRCKVLLAGRHHGRARGSQSPAPGVDVNHFK